MNPPIPFSSASQFASLLMARLASGAIPSGSEVVVQLGGKANNLVDLFALGRTLAICEAVRVGPSKTTTRFDFASLRSTRSLRRLGFFEFCNARALKYSIAGQLEMDIPYEAPDRFTPAEIAHKKAYWRCLVPLEAHAISPTTNELAAARVVSELTRQLANRAALSLDALLPETNAAGPELFQALFRIAKELISNAVMHSTSLEVITAVTLSREASARGRPGRGGVDLSPGQDKIELLVQDFGDGVLRSISRTLDVRDPDPAMARYFSGAPFTTDLRPIAEREQSLLTNIFRGDLVVRKGRQSEGLHDLAHTMAWFGGVLSYSTGRTEIRVTADGRGDVSAKSRESPQVCLPGVVSSALLLSHQVKAACLRTIAHSLGRRQYDKIPRLNRVRPTPSGLFGGLPTAQFRRKSELDAVLIATELTNDDTNAVWLVDLQLSANIDIAYADSLIQELCKREDRHVVFGRLVFVNVPRDVIRALRGRNCHSFLLLHGAICLMLDEVDDVHVLGAPRVSEQAYDVEDALTLIAYASHVTRAELAHHLGLHAVTIAQLDGLFDHCAGVLFHRTPDSATGETYHSCDVQGALKGLRLLHATALNRYRANDGAGVVYALDNGCWVDTVYDFARFWSETDRVLDCARLVLSAHPIPPVDTLVAFMNNGDRLAAGLQRLIGAGTLIIVDPHADPEAWARIEIDDDYILVVDALYPGDDSDGYIHNFIAATSEARGVNDDQYDFGPEARAIFAYCDFRSPPTRSLEVRVERENAASLVVPVAVAAIPPAVLDQIPQALTPSAADRVSGRPHAYGAPGTHVTRTRGAVDATAAPTQTVGLQDVATRRRYSNVELTTEFWQNVTAVGLLEPERIGRESRNVLFYENNERLIQHPRMRRLVTDFVSSFLKNLLELRVDVVLHPTHPIGAFLAQHVVAQLPSAPVVLPITQRRYGGSLELSSAEYEYFRSQLSERRGAYRPMNMRCLILDDSVLSGQSLISMLGVASRLGFRDISVLVLLSRLSPEASAALDLLPSQFAYLYRLHMPLLDESALPDRALRTLNNNVIESATSYFGQWWASEIGAGRLDFSSFFRDVDGTRAITVKKPFVVGGPVRDNRHELRQVINHLILHPDPSVVDFRSRVAIGYNFLESLVEEDAWWELLQTLVNDNATGDARNPSTRFVAALLQILAFSPHVRSKDSAGRYQQVCAAIITVCALERRWVSQHLLVCTALMGLATLGSPLLWDAGGRILDAVLDDAMANLAAGGHEAATGTPDRYAAMAIVGTIAWCVCLWATRNPGLQGAAKGAGISIADRLKETHPIETHLVVIDLAAPLLEMVPDLCGSFNVDVWEREDEFLAALLADSLHNEMANYLVRAPGYTCTLRSLMRICGAQTVLLYMRNEADRKYFLRVFEARKQRAEDELAAEHLDEAHIPDALTARMHSGLFFCSDDRHHASFLDVYSLETVHTWCMGGAVKADDSGNEYYIIFGYVDPAPSTRLRSTAYRYWLRCESLLRQILPQIHNRYTTSSTAWNALVQSLRPLHSIIPGEDERSPFYVRRDVLRNAMARLNVGDMLRRAVRMSSASVNTLAAIRDRIEALVADFGVQLENVPGPNGGLNALMTEISSWPIVQAPLFVREPPPAGNISVRLSEEPFIYCASHVAVMEFIAYECLCNMLSYFATANSIAITLSFSRALGRAEEDGIERISMQMTWINDRHRDADERTNSRGVRACRTAATAIDGTFESENHGDRRVTTVVLPCYRVPESLRKRLEGLLRNTV